MSRTSVPSALLLSKAPLSAFDAEGADLTNFGAPNLGGHTQATVGVGFRPRLLKNLDVGVGYEHAVTSPEGLIEQRVTAHVILRF